jgi:hypothetical protein
MPRGDPVQGIGVVRNLDAVPNQLIAKSYRPRPGGQRRVRQPGGPLGKLSRGQGQGFPEALPGGRVERREDLPSARVQQGQGRALGAPFANPAPEGVKRAGARHRQAEAGAQRPRGGDADPQPGEGAWSQAHRDPIDLRPAASRGNSPLHLLQQARGVPGPPARNRADLRFAQNLAATGSANGGVVRRRIETDYDQLEPPLSS